MSGLAQTLLALMFSVRSHGGLSGITVMPAARPSSSPFRNRQMHHAAADGMLITMRCGLCGRVTHFWATDLVRVLGDNHQVHIPPWPCSRCRTKEFIDMRWQIPSTATLSGLTVRRPTKQITKWLWRDERA